MNYTITKFASGMNIQPPTTVQADNIDQVIYDTVQDLIADADDSISPKFDINDLHATISDAFGSTTIKFRNGKAIIY